MSARSLVPALLLLLGNTGPAARPAPPPIAFNDNTLAAGTMKSGVLELSLDVRTGEWRPYNNDGPALPVLAFGEVGKALTNPGPMIRVIAGTRIHARVTNSATGALVVHGLADRSKPLMDTLVVPAGATREVTFTAGQVGTYFYWATNTGVDFPDRYFDDSQLSGALIVDPVGARPVNERVFVIHFYVPQKDSVGGPDFTNSLLTFNGRPWPYSERFEYQQGDSVHWRFINASADVHPLHLHGFYFRVTARGDFQRDTLYSRAEERMGVTEYFREQTTASLAWKADRPGGWIFHCHLNFHVLPNPALGEGMLSAAAMTKLVLSAPDMSEMHNGNHAEKGMGGLLLAINVKPSAAWKPYAGPRERFRLYIQTDSTPADTARHFGYALAKGSEMPDAHDVKWPGPPIILHKGQPTSIWVINRATEPSQVHWHGLEIDSYYDGVAGISSSGGMVSPMIMPRDSFEVTLIPPRAGSFMYHTHINDLRQQSHGLYGPIIVLDAGETWDPESDLIFQLGSDPTLGFIMNGSAAPKALTLKVGKRYRIRLMNITLDDPNNQFWMTSSTGQFPLWTPLAKDGYDLPEWQRTPRRSRQAVSIGETYDFAVTFPAAGEFEMQGRLEGRGIYARQVIHVVK